MYPRLLAITSWAGYAIPLTVDLGDVRRIYGLIGPVGMSIMVETGRWCLCTEIRDGRIDGAHNQVADQF